MQQKTFLRVTAEALMRAVVVVLTIVVILVTVSAFYEVETGVSDGECNVAVYPIEGVILPYRGFEEFELVITPDEVARFFDDVEREDAIDAVLLELNTPGGTPVASARIAERIHESSLPVVGLAGDIAASGGYLIAAATDQLVASPMSDVGGIGVNMSYVEESKKNEEEGLTYVQLTTGKFKDIGSPNRPITEEERALLEADLQLVHDEFVRLVAGYRGLEIEAVEELADGASVPGARGLESGLVDALGGRVEAKAELAKLLFIPEEDIVFCEYEPPLLLF